MELKLACHGEHFPEIKAAALANFKTDDLFISPEGSQSPIRQTLTEYEQSSGNMKGFCKSVILDSEMKA